MKQIAKKSPGLPLGPGLPKGYRRDIVAFNAFLGGRPADRKAVEDYFADMRAKGRKAATIQHHKASIKASIMKASGKGMSVEQLNEFNDFFRRLEVPKRDVAVTEDFLTVAEIKDLIAAAGPKTGLLVKALWHTAARVSELVSIRLSDCEAGKDGVSIRILGKGSKEGVVYMTTDLYEDIRKAYRGKEYLFEFRGGPVSRHNVYTLIRRAGVKMGRDRIVHPHTVRHSWATANLPILGLPKVSKYLRHSQLETTVKHYLHGKASKSEILAASVLQLAV